MTMSSHEAEVVRRLEKRLNRRNYLERRAIQIGAGFALLVALSMWGCPQYFVWEREMAGRSELAQAEWNRQIAVEEAQAKLASADLERQAEVIRASGVADANEIIGQSLQGNEAYLRYLWIQGLHDGSSEIIYIPTEANLPILEATRLEEK